MFLRGFTKNTFSPIFDFRFLKESTGKKPENHPIFNFRKIGKNTYNSNFDPGFELVPCQQPKVTPPVEKS